MPDEVLRVEPGAKREAPEEVFRARARRLEVGVDARPELRHGRRPHVRADERIFRLRPGHGGAAGLVMAPVAADAVELDAPVEALLEVEPGIVVHLRRARLEVAVVKPVGARLALVLLRHPEELEPDAARPLDHGVVHTVVPHVEESDLGSGPSERGTDSGGIGAVAKGGDVDNRNFAGVYWFRSRSLDHDRFSERAVQSRIRECTPTRNGRISECRCRTAQVEERFASSPDSTAFQCIH